MKKKTILSFFITTAFLILLSGCSNKKQIPFKSIQMPKNKKAKVYIFRPSQAYIAGAVTFETYVVKDNKEWEFLALLPRNSYFSKEFEAGGLDILIDGEFNTNIHLDLKPGEVYCVDVGAIPGLLTASASAKKYKGANICSKLIKGTNLYSTPKDYLKRKEYLTNCKNERILDGKFNNKQSCEEKYESIYIKSKS